jgi:hypothetical protein
MNIELIFFLCSCTVTLLLFPETLSSSLQIPEAHCKKSASPTKNQLMREDKRIVHPNILRVYPFGQEQQSVLSPSMYEDGATFPHRKYALERKDPPFSINIEFTGQEHGIYMCRLSFGKNIVAMDKQADVRKKKETESSLDVGREYPYKHLKPANIQALARQ